MSTDITVAIPGEARVGEGPFWDGETGQLTWVDILAGRVHTADPAVPHPHTLTLPTFVGAAVPKASGGYVAATTEGFTDVRADGTWTIRLAVLPRGRRMNDAKCDRAGRFWAGSCDLDFAAARGALHVLAPDWRTEHILGDLTQPNGLDWSPDGRTFYLIDTAARELNAFDALPGRLAPANRRVLARFPETLGFPDGMTVDIQGCLWIAMWGGGRILRLSPEGRILTEVPVPVAQPSSCAFGGPNLDVLYVTTAREGLDLDSSRPDGSVLAVRGLGARGLPMTRFGG
ncbi:SMP-30/gluconolactonase/LRE family protein [Streptomyces sp. NPDC001698]|uniref:SMP-30/gluconolactonase/LRE family protein n=1 Tax=unclassified Streptomyces TaxID=2593676 RepID=UPI0036934D4B